MNSMLVKSLGSLAFGFLVGVFAHSLFPYERVSMWFLIGIIGLALVLFFTLYKKRKLASILALALIGLSFGLLRFAASVDMSKAHILDVFAEKNEQILLHGRIDSEPIERGSFTEFQFQAENLITHGKEVLPLDTRILVKTDNYAKYQYGQEVTTEGNIQVPAAFITDTDREFDYQQYLKKDQVYYVMSYAEVAIFDEGKQSLLRRLYTLKDMFLNHIYRIIPEPESGLLAGILFGQKSALSDDLEDAFRIVGLMHIVVLSGYNVSLVIQIFTKALRFLPIGIRSVLAVLSICIFALLVGAGPTVIRASIMAVFIVLADVLGGRYNITRALFIAGLVMVVWNPLILYFDISFQLSFLATFGLIQFSPYLEKKFSFLPSWFSIKESAVATIAAQIMVLPLIIYKIGEFSIISPIVNVLVLFAVPWAMLLGFIAAALDIIAPSISMLVALPTTFLLRYQLSIVDFFSGFSFSQIDFPPFSFVMVAGLYGLIFLWLRRIHKKQRNDLA